MLDIYLNDHLAGATGGLELARRTAAAHKDTPEGPDLARLAEEIALDRQSLLVMMRRLDVDVRQSKVVAGWVAEKVGRLKPNGTVVRRSPLSSVVELEGLLIGIHGKSALWRTLLALGDPQLDAPELQRLLARAEDQLGRVEAMRLRHSVEACARTAVRA
jgi:hypothetical protein